MIFRRKVIDNGIYFEGSMVFPCKKYSLSSINKKRLWFILKIQQIPVVQPQVAMDTLQTN